MPLSTPLPQVVGIHAPQASLSLTHHPHDMNPYYILYYVLGLHIHSMHATLHTIFSMGAEGPIVWENRDQGLPLK